jgi:hypothetical protein
MAGQDDGALLHDAPLVARAGSSGGSRDTMDTKIVLTIIAVALVIILVGVIPYLVR